MSDNAEIKEILHQILANRRGELNEVREMQDAGDHVAEPIMLAGQNVRPILSNSIIVIDFHSGLTGVTSYA